MYRKLGIASLMIALLISACAPKVQRSTNSPAPFSYPYTTIKNAFGKQGMVVSAHPLATEVGVQILKQGGNAVDASIAVQFALAVVYPQAGNIGGGGFMVYRSASAEVASLDYREKAPASAHRDMYLDSTGQVIKGMSSFGRYAAGVPGSVAGMWAAHQKYGKLSWSKLVAPAILLAERGFQVTPQEARNLNRERNNFMQYNPVIPGQFVKETWAPSDLLVQKELAATLKRIKKSGHNGFYQGETARLIVEDSRRNNGHITEKDLQDYKAVWRTPIEFDYKDCHLISMPPPSSGGILIQQMLGMLESQPIAAMGFHSQAAIHLMSEIERRAYADRAEHMGDADFWPVPIKELTARPYLVNRMANYQTNKATPSASISAGKFKESEETTHLSIVDGQGNAVSVTTTLNDSYGSRAVVAGAGFILNNEMDDFSAKPGVPNIYGLVGSEANSIAAGKRMLSSMTPTIVLRNQKLWMVVGTPGGSTIPTSVFQTFVNVREFGLPLKDAVHNARFHHQHLPDKIQMEHGAFSPELIDALRKMGHEVAERDPIGRVEAIILLPDGRLEGVADKRGDDHAAGW